MAIATEQAAQGMATAAIGALLLRVCDKRYGATQFALLSSLFGLGRTLAGVPSGFIAASLGYPGFFLVSVAAALPGRALLQVIAPIQQREIPSASPAPADMPVPAPDEAAELE